MDRTISMIATAWLAIVGAMALTCIGPGGGGGGGPTGNCEQAPATDPGAVNAGDLDVALGKSRYMRRERRQDAAGMADGGGSMRISDYVFEPLPEENPTYQLQRGPQGGGGIHLEPAILARGIESPETEALVRFQVRDPETDEVLTHTACEDGTLEAWRRLREGYMFDSFRVIFDTNSWPATDGPRELIADIQIGDGRRVIKRRISVQ